MQDDRPPAVTNWIKAEKQYDPELAKLLEAPLTSLFIPSINNQTDSECHAAEHDRVPAVKPVR